MAFLLGKKTLIPGRVGKIVKNYFTAIPVLCALAPHIGQPVFFEFPVSMQTIFPFWVPT
jgi:hypothetical protein